MYKDKKIAVVAVSGGLDSCVTAAIANEEYELAFAHINYGQRTQARELKAFNDIADFYENSVDTKLSILTSTIEPLLMIVMGFLIGFIVLAMYMPIFQMATTIS